MEIEVPAGFVNVKKLELSLEPCKIHVAPLNVPENWTVRSGYLTELIDDPSTFELVMVDHVAIWASSFVDVNVGVTEAIILSF